MRWKDINEDTTAGRTPPAGWTEQLERGRDDVRHGRVVPVSDVIRDLDTTLEDMANEADGVGRDENITDSATTDKRS